MWVAHRVKSKKYISKIKNHQMVFMHMMRHEIYSTRKKEREKKKYPDN